MQGLAQACPTRALKMVMLYIADISDHTYIEKFLRCPRHNVLGYV